MSWLRFLKKSSREAPKSGPSTPPQGPARPKGTPTSGYGSNPYDTYTWELHTDPDGERAQKRAHVVDKRPDKDGDPFNPYDTGKFSGGW